MAGRADGGSACSASALAEVGVVAVEATIYVVGSRRLVRFPRRGRCALAANALSFAVGLVVLLVAG